jgi:hypothetical protein
MWLLVCGALTALGLAASLPAFGRRGAGAGLRGVAWSLLPMVAYLTGVAGLVWKLGTAVSHWALGFVFSPKVWAGIALAGLAAVLFAVSGPLRRRAPAGRSRAGAGAGLPAGASAGTGRALEPGTRTQPLPSSKGRGKARAGARAGGVDNEFAEVEEILRRRGIS